MQDSSIVWSAVLGLPSIASGACESREGQGMAGMYAAHNNTFTSWHYQMCVVVVLVSGLLLLQLAELLTWMNTYQQQWSSYVSHVQKQIARQQRLAKQQLIRQLQEGSSLEGSIDDEELQQQHSEFGQQLQQQLAQAQQQLLSLQQQAQQQLQNFQQQAANENSGREEDKH
jgi:hypothetical protein